MRKTAIFVFSMPRWTDLLLYLLFIADFFIALQSVEFDTRFISDDTRGILLGTSFIAHWFIYLTLYRWISNATNLLLLVVIGVAFGLLFLEVFDYRFASQSHWNIVSMVLWLPVLITLVAFRILKLNVMGEELAIPWKNRTDFYGQRPTWIDILALFVGLFVIVGLVAIINLSAG